MNPTLRSTLAILAGIIVVPLVVMMTEEISAQVYPMPPEAKEDNLARAEWMKTLPAQAYLFVLAAWTAGAFVGGGVCSFIAGRWHRTHALAIGCFVLLAILQTARLLPGQPAWVTWVGILLPIPASILAGAAVSPGSAPAAAAAPK